MSQKNEPSVFVSYRTADTKKVALPLAEKLEAALSTGKVFLDRKGIQGGDEWPETLKDELTASSVVLVLIGTRWLTEQNEFGQRRLDVEDDWVRREIAMAFREGKTLIPVLIDGADPLVDEALVTLKDIRKLARIQALELVFDKIERDLEPILDRLVEDHGFRRTGSEATADDPGPTVVSNIPLRGSAPFVGREDELDEIAQALENREDARLVVLTGPSGVGKSELAFEFARQNASHYAGRTFHIDASVSGPAAEMASLGSSLFGLVLPDGSMEEKAQFVLRNLATRPVLIVFDNVERPLDVDPFLPPAGSRVHILATTNHDEWDHRWHRIDVDSIDDQEALELVEELSGPDIAREHGRALITEADGVLAQLVPAAKATERDVRRGRPVRTERLGPGTQGSYGRLWNSMSEEARRLLYAAAHFHPDRIDEVTLISTMECDDLGIEDVNEALEACLSTYALRGSGTLRIHRLLRAFVLKSLEDDSVRGAVLALVRDTADAVVLAPGDAEQTERLVSVDLGVLVPAPEDCTVLGEALQECGHFDEALPFFERALEHTEEASANDQVNHADLGRSLHQIGYCHSSRGRFDEALPFYERAVEQKEQGDLRGRVNHESIGDSLHQIGYCHSSRGRLDEALPFYERAFEEREQGDLRGRVNHENLGAGLHQIGFCHSICGRFGDALPFYERAVEHKEQGDLHGRVDRGSMGLSLHEIGVCHSRHGRDEDALRFFERAVEHKEQGDLHGRVDHGTLGMSLHEIGYCHSNGGREEEALPFYERAVEHKEQGDLHGRINHGSLGSGLHQIGICHSRRGRHEDALPFYERAVEHKKQGDLHGRVDHGSLAMSLHEIGYCHSRIGRHDDALTFYELAVERHERGDLYGRVNREGLEASRSAIAACRESQKSNEA